MRLRVKGKTPVMDIARKIRQIDSTMDTIPFITMKFLSEKQEECQDKLDIFQNKYGVTFRDYELISNILEKYDNEDSSYISDLKSALNVLKNSKVEYIKEIFTRVPNEINEKTFENILEILLIEDNNKELYEMVHYVQLEEASEKNNTTIVPHFSKLLGQLAQVNHEIVNVYDPSCRDAQIITALDDFSHATLYEKDEQEYYHVMQNMIINEIAYDKISLTNQEKIIDDTEAKYDTIISIPYKKGKLLSKSKENLDKYEEYKTKKSNSIHLLNLIDHLEDDGVLITTTSQDLLVKKDAYNLRKCLIENNLLDSVIEYETGFRTRDLTILIIKKNKKTDDFLFIKPRQLLPGLLLPGTDEEILKSYKNWEKIQQFSNIISKEQIIKNEYNLNPKRYVYTLDYEKKSIPEILEKQQEYTSKIRHLDEEIEEMLKKVTDN